MHRPDAKFRVNVIHAVYRPLRGTKEEVTSVAADAFVSRKLYGVCSPLCPAVQSHALLRLLNCGREIKVGSGYCFLRDAFSHAIRV